MSDKKAAALVTILRDLPCEEVFVACHLLIYHDIARWEDVFEAMSIVTTDKMLELKKDRDHE